MAERKAVISARLPIRRGLGEGEAGVYIGVGATKFSELVKDGRMPKPRVIDGRRVWDIDDLDAAFRDLPYEGEKPKNNPWLED